MCSCSTDQGDYYWKVTLPAAEEMDWGQDTELSAAGLLYRKENTCFSQQPAKCIYMTEARSYK